MGERPIVENLSKINERIRFFEDKYHRPPGSTSLIAVTKGQPVEVIRAAFEAGQRDFGENYLQEFLGKKDFLSDLTAIWHFIGKIQSNKTREIAEHFSWVHSVDREKIAQRLNEQRPESLPKLNICIEVNVSQDPKKSGITESEIGELAQAISQCKKLHLRGLMTILQETSDFAEQLHHFQKLAKLFEDLNKKGFALDTLSMGMSLDFEAAIAAGATYIRVGRAIFGERE